MRSEFIVERNGKSFVLYAGLLDEAHSQGLELIETEVIQLPNQDNGPVAVVKATVKTSKGVYTGLGDASPQNVARPMITCLLRMAETRAKARALRDAINVAMVSFEETDPHGSGPGDDEESAAAPAGTIMDGVRQARENPNRAVSKGEARRRAEAALKAAGCTPAQVTLQLRKGAPNGTAEEYLAVAARAQQLGQKAG